MSNNQNDINKAFEMLPEDVKEAITSVETVEVLQEIQSKYKLHLDQIQELSGEIGLLMMGEIPPQRFVKNIQISMNISSETAKEITVEVNEKIFKQIRESLMTIHKMDEETPDSPPASKEVPKNEAKKEETKEQAKTEEPKEDAPPKLTPDSYREPIE